MKKRGRPQTERIRKKQGEKKKRFCTYCLKSGHNRRRCYNEPPSSESSTGISSGNATPAPDSDSESTSASSFEERISSPGSFDRVNDWRDWAFDDEGLTPPPLARPGPLALLSSPASQSQLSLRPAMSPSPRQALRSQRPASRPLSPPIAEDNEGGSSGEGSGGEDGGGEGSDREDGDREGDSEEGSDGGRGQGEGGESDSEEDEEDLEQRKLAVKLATEDDPNEAHLLDCIKKFPGPLESAAWV